MEEPQETARSAQWFRGIQSITRNCIQKYRVQVSECRSLIGGGDSSVVGSFASLAE
jgi:hypothetical protein